MCGIVGYLGPKEVSEVLLEGLKTLEYRGYDSAGIAVAQGGTIQRLRASGKLSNLEEKLYKEGFLTTSSLNQKSKPNTVANAATNLSYGIGHTRWATHGKAVESNAHPHNSKGLYLVHNGIIENYYELKEELKTEGIEFSSETDSELVAHLIQKEFENGKKSLLEAVQKVKPKLKGAYAILVLHEQEPQTMIAFKEGPPLIVAKKENEFFFASDALAVLPYTNEVSYLDDGEIILLKDQKLELIGADSSPKKIQWNLLDLKSFSADKAGYEHYMLKEIFEQPVSFKKALQPHIENYKLKLDADSLLSCDDIKSFDRIFMVACGTSYYATVYAKYLFESMSDLPVEVDVASEFRYRRPKLNSSTLVVVVSQSGETADTLAALRLAKSQGAKVLSICNSKKSTIDREADFKFYMNSGTEIGVASTKAFTSSMGVLSLLALAFAKVRSGLSLAEEEESLRALLSVPAKMEALLAYDTFFSETAQSFKSFKAILYMGRGVHYPIALEGALKMKELAYKHAEGYAAGEMKHGPLALIDKDVLVLMLCPKDELYEKTLSNLEEAKARGAYIVSMGTLEDKKLKELSEHYLSMPESKDFTSAILEALPLQLLSYHVSKSLGHDVDQPRNLAKSVTVE